MTGDERKALAAIFVLAGLHEKIQADYGGSGVWYIREARYDPAARSVQDSVVVRDPALWGGAATTYSAARVRLEWAKWPELGAIAYALEQGAAACPFCSATPGGLRHGCGSVVGFSSTPCPWVENGLLELPNWPVLKRLDIPVGQAPPDGLIDR